MLDIKFIRENLEIVKLAAQKKHIDIDLDRLISVDDSRREVMQRMEEKKAEQNKLGESVAGASDTERPAIIERLSAIKADV